ncbi:MAG: hypothetical protein ACJ8GN_18585 [Longimicrobiaceae bacterium]
MEPGRKTLDDPAAAFLEPFVGPVGAVESAGDEYIPLKLKWPRESSLSPRIWLRIDGWPRTLVEIAFDSDTYQLSDVTLVIASPETWRTRMDDRLPVPVVEGLPRCDPVAWTARSRTGGFNDHGDYYLRADAAVRIAATPSEAVLYLDGIAGEVAMELASGRARIGVDARGAIAYVRLTELTANEAALLEDHRSR